MWWIVTGAVVYVIVATVVLWNDHDDLGGV